jgi:DNA-binding CsgD family transcriptional regulator
MHRATQADAFVATVEAVYAAGLDAELWPQALAAIARSLGGVGTTLEVFDRTTFVHREFRCFGVASTEELAYLRDYAADNNPRFLPALRQKPGKTSVDYEFIDEAGMDRSPFYAKFLAAQDLRYTIGGIMNVERGEFGVVAVQRARRQGHVGRAEIATMERLLPHVQGAFDMTRRLRGADAARHSLERALDWLADGVILVRADGRVLYANQAFDAMARREDGIRLRKGEIEFAAVEARSRFAAALAAAGRLRNSDPDSVGCDFPIMRPSGAPPYLVSVRPLPLNRRDAHAEARADAIVFFRDPMSRNAAATHVLREVFGLTEAEASIAQALQAGVPLADYARTHRVSLNTIYTHLKRVKAKTGCHRMPELIRRLNDLQGPLRADQKQ